VIASVRRHNLYWKDSLLIFTQYWLKGSLVDFDPNSRSLSALLIINHSVSNHLDSRYVVWTISKHH
jgi:hypothetical protein